MSRWHHYEPGFGTANLSHERPWRPLTGWLWFLDFPPDGVALDASGEPDDLREQLTAHFSVVEVLPEGGHLPWETSTFDCIVLHRNVPRREDLVQLRSLLKPGGWLVAAAHNPACIGGGRIGGGGTRPGVLARLFATSGLRHIRVIHALPSLDRPMDLVPDAHHAVTAYEGLSSMHSVSWPRRLMAALGMRRMMYPAYYIMGKR